MIRILVILTCLLLTTAAQADAALARVLSTSPGATPTRLSAKIKVERGSFYADHAVEVLAPSGKVAATMALPAGIQMLMKGDEVAVTLALTKPLAAPAFVADAGGFATAAAAQASLVVAAAPAAAKPAPKPPATAALPKATACPYTPAEVAAALGVSVKAGAPSETPFPGGVDYGCAYDQTAGHMTLWVQQMVMSAADQRAGDAPFQQTLAGQLTAIPRDPDGARWQLDPYDPRSVALHYLRGTHRVTIRLTGGNLKAEALQPKLLRLRRLP